MVIGDLALWEKTGGRSGIYRRETAADGPIDSSTHLGAGADDLGSDVSDTVTNVVES
jgi:hypothetical protein